MAGSLIKNAGGGIARTGGYIAGRKDLVEKISYRLTAPGLGRHTGASLGFNRNLYQGLFMAPTVTAGALNAAESIIATAMIGTSINAPNISIP